MSRYALWRLDRVDGGDAEAGEPALVALELTSGNEDALRALRDGTADPSITISVYVLSGHATSAWLGDLWADVWEDRVRVAIVAAAPDAAMRGVIVRYTASCYAGVRWTVVGDVRYASQTATWELLLESPTQIINEERKETPMAYAYEVHVRPPTTKKARSSSYYKVHYGELRMRDAAPIPATLIYVTREASRDEVAYLLLPTNPLSDQVYASSFRSRRHDTQLDGAKGPIGEVQVAVGLDAKGRVDRAYLAALGAAQRHLESLAPSFTLLHSTRPGYAGVRQAAAERSAPLRGPRQLKLPEPKSEPQPEPQTQPAPEPQPEPNAVGARAVAAVPGTELFRENSTTRAGVALLSDGATVPALLTRRVAKVSEPAILICAAPPSSAVVAFLARSHKVGKALVVGPWVPVKLDGIGERGSWFSDASVQAQRLVAIDTVLRVDAPPPKPEPEPAPAPASLLLIGQVVESLRAALGHLDELSRALEAAKR